MYLVPSHTPPFHPNASFPRQFLGGSAVRRRRRLFASPPPYARRSATSLYPRLVFSGAGLRCPLLATCVPFPHLINYLPPPYFVLLIRSRSTRRHGGANAPLRSFSRRPFERQTSSPLAVLFVCPSTLHSSGARAQVYLYAGLSGARQRRADPTRPSCSSLPAPHALLDALATAEASFCIPAIASVRGRPRPYTAPGGSFARCSSAPLATHCLTLFLRVRF